MKKRIWMGMMATVMALAVSGCGTKNTAENTDPIKIATKPMTEQYVLGEMIGLILEENYGYSVEITKGIGGGTNNIQPAMLKGEFDLYPEYTSSGWVLVLGHDTKDAEGDALYTQMKEEYEAQFGLTWTGLYGFNNTYTVVTRQEVAATYGLKKTSDLAGISNELIFGGNPDYIERGDGFPLLCDTYGLGFQEVKDIDIGLKYTALLNGDIDVTNAFTTDAQLGNAENKLVVLEDDLNLQANYLCGTVVRMDALEKYDKLEEALNTMTGLITDGDMATMNYQVEVEGKDEKDVARTFLVEKGLLQDK